VFKQKDAYFWKIHANRQVSKRNFRRSDMRVSKFKFLTLVALAAISTMTSACSSTSNDNFLSGAGYRSAGTYNETITP
jgi:hypothetical protein